MADMKLTADLDVRVNTDSIAADIARAIAGVTGHVTPNTAPIHAYDAAIAGLGERAGVAYLRGNAANAMGLPDVPGTLNSFARFASMAAASPYGYTPSTIQSMIRSSVTNAMKDYEVSPDLKYKLDMERITGQLRAQQRENRLSALAGVYAMQGGALADAAAKASTPEAQRILLGRAASRYGAISSRTFMESGAVSPETAAEALSISANLSAIRSGIKTQAQVAAQQDKLYSAMGASLTSKEAQEDAAWATREYGADRKARDMERGFAKIESASAALASEIEGNAIASRNAIMGARYRIRQDAKREITLRSRIAALKETEYNLIAAEAGTQAAQEDAAWAAREKELAYDPLQKAREMEKGFHAMEASSATEAAYNPNADPAVVRDTISSSIAAANRYTIMAGRYGAGTAERQAYIQMARGALSGVTMNSMAKAGLSSDAIKENTTAILNITKILQGLGSEGAGGGGGSDSVGLYNVGRRIGRLMTAAGAVATDVMSGRTQWLADTSTPYQTRRDVRQDWAIKYGAASIVPGAIAGATIGTAILPGVGTVVGGLVGGGVGLTAQLLGQHYKDEKKIGDAQQSKAIDMLRWRNLYGPGVEYNYAQYAENTGYISATSMMGLNQAADMLPGAMMFGAVNEQQMMALSYMPNYWAALMEGRSTSEIASAYAYDIGNLPREMRQYITSLLPGASEDLRAYVQSESFRTGNALAREFGSYDATQYGYAPGWERGRQKVSAENIRAIQANYVSETAVANAPNYYGNYNEWANAMVDTTGAAAYANADVMRAWRETAGRLGLRGELGNGDTSNGMLGNIVINIDGNTIYNEAYTVDDFVKSNQTYVIGGV